MDEINNYYYYLELFPFNSVIMLCFKSYYLYIFVYPDKLWWQVMNSIQYTRNVRYLTIVEE